MDSLLDTIYRLLIADKQFLSGAIICEGKIIKQIEKNDNPFISILNQNKFSNKMNIVAKGNRQYLFVQPINMEGWTVSLRANGNFTESNINFIKNVFNQAKSIRSNLQNITLEIKLLANLSVIFNELDFIAYIKGANQYVEIYFDGHDNKNKLALISLKTIKFYCQ